MLHPYTHPTRVVKNFSEPLSSNCVLESSNVVIVRLNMEIVGSSFIIPNEERRFYMHRIVTEAIWEALERRETKTGVSFRISSQNITR